MVDALNGGASLAAIARREGVATRRVRDIVHALLATKLEATAKAGADIAERRPPGRRLSRH